MRSELVSVLLSIGALVLGGVIGLAFGSLQNAALIRRKKLLKDMSPEEPMIPGSASRVGFLLIVLVLIQVTCPIFFEGALIQWVVTAGVILGYGWTLRDQLRLRSTFIK
jgi:hypothetical protein